MTTPTNPEDLEFLQNLKIPSDMAAGKGLRDFLIKQAQSGPIDDRKVGEELLTRLTMSHLEILNLLGTQEEAAKPLRENLQKLKDNLQMIRDRRANPQS